MAVYHFSTQIIGRSSGRSVVAAAAYRARESLPDERTGLTHDFSQKTDLIHGAILLPEGAPDRFADRATLWNEVERIERRKDAQLAREIEFALPMELSDAANLELARAFVQETFVDQGMIADLAVHKPTGEDGRSRPHAHVLLTLRAVGPNGFGLKIRAWGERRDLLVDWRERWAVRANEALATAGVASRVDHRSHRARGVPLEPQGKLGPVAAKLLKEGLPSRRFEVNRATAFANGKKLIAHPWLGLDFLTEGQSTFTRAELARFVARNTGDAEQFRIVLAKLEGHADLVRLGRDGRGEERFSTRRMVAIERAMAEHAAELAATESGNGLGAIPPLTASEAALGPEQRRALAYLLDGKRLRLLVGYAGTGKSRLLAAARARWQAQRRRVVGASLSAMAARGLAQSSGIPSRTLASLEWAWACGRDKLAAGDVLVVDEAAMVGSRQLERVLAEVRRAGATAVLVGDPAQLQPISAGSAMRALVARHGAATLREVRRQITPWMRQATRELATGQVATALRRYETAGMVRAAPTQAEAMLALIDSWDQDRCRRPNGTRLILAHARRDVDLLNELARERVRLGGALGGDRVVRLDGNGSLVLAPGDRVRFGANAPGMGVRNGDAGVVTGIDATASRLTVRLDGAGRGSQGETVQVDTRRYGSIARGYATTLHKAQGQTVDRTFLAASRGLDRNTAYVGLTRHTRRIEVHHGRDLFRFTTDLARTMGRDRGKDTTLEHGADRQRDRTRMGQAIRRAVDRVRGSSLGQDRERAVQVKHHLERQRAQRERGMERGR